jgi:hypothetical protein
VTQLPHPSPFSAAQGKYGRKKRAIAGPGVGFAEKAQKICRPLAAYATPMASPALISKNISNFVKYCENIGIFLL